MNSGILEYPPSSRDLLPGPGTYVLWLRLAAKRRVRVGCLGVLDFECGYYAYVGSAFGPGGIAARLGRHFRRGKKKRWHIDYLRSACRLQGAWVGYDRARCEHRWAECLLALPGARAGAPRFGSSDCGCETHLVHFGRMPALRSFCTKTALNCD